MEPFAEAMEIVAEVMRHGAASHPDNDWLKRPLSITSSVPRSICSFGVKATNYRTI